MANERGEAPRPLPGDTSQREDTLVQIYWAIYETWSAQVDSYWTRTNYFTAFEAAALAGTWIVFDDKAITKSHWYILVAALIILLLAIVLTTAWIFSNIKSYDYHIYWWGLLGTIEKDKGWRSVKPDYVSEHDRRRKRQPILSRFPLSIFSRYDYHDFTNLIVPIAFFIVWFILIIALVLLRWNPAPSPASDEAFVDLASFVIKAGR